MKCFTCISSSILKTILFSTYYYKPHFTNEENKDLGRLCSRVRMHTLNCIPSKNAWKKFYTEGDDGWY